MVIVDDGDHDNDIGHDDDSAPLLLGEQCTPSLLCAGA